jgi:rod shape-determining protein MreD
MLAILIALPIFGGLAILQSAIVSATPLLQGTADVLLLTMIAWALQERVQVIWQWAVIAGVVASLLSGLPFGVYLIAYLVSTGLVVILRRYLLEAPFLAMWVMTFLGTLIVHAISLAARWLTGAEIPLITAFNLITLPSILLNLLLAVPVYAMVRDLANWLYPEELEV